MARTTKLYQLKHCTYHCSYHIVWCPRFRGKVLADNYIKQQLMRMFKQIANWKGLIIYAWHIGDEHIHLHISIPPKYSIAYIIQILKGKTSGWIKKKTKKFPRGVLWGRGYYVSTVGISEIAVKNYVKNQEHHQVELQQLKLMD
jgi:putative transposase